MTLNDFFDTNSIPQLVSELSNDDLLSLLDFLSGLTETQLDMPISEYLYDPSVQALLKLRPATTIH